VRIVIKDKIQERITELNSTKMKILLKFKSNKNSYIELLNYETKHSWKILFSAKIDMIIKS